MASVVPSKNHLPAHNQPPAQIGFEWRIRGASLVGYLSATLRITTIPDARPLRRIRSQQPVDETSMPEGKEIPGELSLAIPKRCAGSPPGASSRRARTMSESPAVLVANFHKIFVLPLFGAVLFG